MVGLGEIVLRVSVERRLVRREGPWRQRWLSILFSPISKVYGPSFTC